MMALAMRFLPQIIGGVAIISVLGVGWWKVSSYMSEHDELVDAYDRQALELNQAAEVNQNNVTELARIRADHVTTLIQLQGQLDTEAITANSLEGQLARLRSLEAPVPEIRYVNSDTDCAPTYDVHPTLADPFGVPVEPS